MTGGVGAKKEGSPEEESSEDDDRYHRRRGLGGHRDFNATHRHPTVRRALAHLEETQPLVERCSRYFHARMDLLEELAVSVVESRMSRQGEDREVNVAKMVTALPSSIAVATSEGGVLEGEEKGNEGGGGGAKPSDPELQRALAVLSLIEKSRKV